MKLLPVLMLAVPLALFGAVSRPEPVTRPESWAWRTWPCSLATSQRPGPLRGLPRFRRAVHSTEARRLGRIAFVKINDRQWIELFNRPSAGEGQLNHIAIYTDDADRMRDYLASQGVAVPERVGKGRTGNKNFMVKDPDGHNVEIVEYMPDSWTAKNAGQHLPPTRVSEQAIHVGVLVGNLDASMKFYDGILGFQEFWRGSSAPRKHSAGSICVCPMGPTTWSSCSTTKSQRPTGAARRTIFPRRSRR